MKNNVNPKSLKGQDKLNRMLDLMGKMTTLNESKSFSELELIKKGPNGIVYGIVRENHDYFIKTSNKTNGQFLAEDFNYIGGLQNKGSEKYHSYSEALKQLNLKFDMLNESYGIENNINIFESDGVAFGGGVGFGFVMEEDETEEEKKELISDSDDELEEAKSVIKVDVPKQETPVEAPVEDEVEDEVDVDMGGDIADMDFGDTEDTDEEDGDNEDGDEVTKKIQKLTGKITQLMRDSEKVDPEIEKYVINSVISAMHLDDMDEGDKEDIISKLEGDEEEGSFDNEPKSEEPKSEETDEPTEELSEENKKGKEDEFITVNGKKYKRVDETKTFTKKTLMRKLSNNKRMVESRYVCEECMGKGCSTCSEQDANESTSPFKDNRKNIDVRKPYGVINKKDFEGLRRGERPSKKRVMDEDMDVLDSVRYGKNEFPSSVDFTDRFPRNNGLSKNTSDYDFDRDFDGIPNRLDLDKDNNGRADYPSTKYNNQEDFIELDYDFIMNNPAPVKEPGIQKPITKPGEGDKWKKIKKPLVRPIPKAGLEDFEMNNPAPVKEPGIQKPITKPGEGDKWKKIKKPLVKPIPKAEEGNLPKPSFRRRGMFR